MWTAGEERTLDRPVVRQIDAPPRSIVEVSAARKRHRRQDCRPVAYAAAASLMKGLPVGRIQGLIVGTVARARAAASGSASAGRSSRASFTSGRTS